MPQGSSIITLLTDFGVQDAFVGIMKGVILGIAPSTQIIDLSHEVPPQNILAGALLLRSAVRHFPTGSIHVAVVDPGVGSSRKGIIVETPDGFFVGPDNGLLSLSVPEERISRITHLTNTDYFLDQPSHTFHGRDIFAPVAAHLAQGVSPEQFGLQLSALERLNPPAPMKNEQTLTGTVLYIDHFGNAITNISTTDIHPFSTQQLWVSIEAHQLGQLVSTYANVEEGAPAVLINSWGQIEIAIRNGSAAQELSLQPGSLVEIHITKPGPLHDSTLT